MSREILLIRHAESEMNLRPELIGGRSNWAPISERGRQQAITLGTYLLQNELIPTKVVSSPAIRTLQTAEHSLAAMGLDMHVETEDAIQELDQGEWEGRLRAEMYTPDMSAHINAMNGAFRPPKGESPRDAARRMYASLSDRAASLDEGESMHVYSHGFAIRSLVGSLNGWNHQEVLSAKTDNTSITRLEYDGYLSVTDFARMPELMEK